MHPWDFSLFGNVRKLGNTFDVMFDMFQMMLANFVNINLKFENLKVGVSVMFDMSKTLKHIIVIRFYYVLCVK